MTAKSPVGFGEGSEGTSNLMQNVKAILGFAHAAQSALLPSLGSLASLPTKKSLARKRC